MSIHIVFAVKRSRKKCGSHHITKPFRRLFRRLQLWPWRMYQCWSRERVAPGRVPWHTTCISAVAAGKSHFWWWTAQPFLKIWWRVSFLAIMSDRVSWCWRMAERCSWTRWKNWRSRRSPGSCTTLGKTETTISANARLLYQIRGLLHPLARRWNHWWIQNTSVGNCFFNWAPLQSPCRRCESGGMTLSRWRINSFRTTMKNTIVTWCFPPRSIKICKNTIGREIYRSWRAM